MKAIFLLLVALLPLHAQTDLAKLLAEGMRGAVAGLAPVAEKDKSDVLAVTAELLAKHVTFRADGTASAIFTIPGTRQQVEWKKLVVRSISIQPVTEADRLNGISRRSHVRLGCDAHRTQDAKRNAWGGMAFHRQSAVPERFQCRVAARRMGRSRNGPNQVVHIATCNPTLPFLVFRREH